MGANETLPQPAVAEDSLDHIRLATFDKTDDLHRAATFGTFQWIDFVESLDQTRLDYQFSSWPLFPTLWPIFRPDRYLATESSHPLEKHPFKKMTSLSKSYIGTFGSPCFPIISMRHHYFQ